MHYYIQNKEEDKREISRVDAINWIKERRPMASITYFEDKCKNYRNVGNTKENGYSVTIKEDILTVKE